MNIFRFRDRVGVLDERSRRFLTTMAWLGGYVTPEQAQELGIRNSVTRVHVQLQDLESWGFIKRVAAYPAIYQVTKSVTRLMGADLAARREHANETIRTRLLTVNFYLEAIRWPVEFCVRAPAEDLQTLDARLSTCPLPGAWRQTVSMAGHSPATSVRRTDTCDG